jgi:hypothetical protein
MKKIDFCILKVAVDFGTDPHPDSYQKVTDPEHWKIGTWSLTVRFKIYRYIYLFSIYSR